MLRSLFTGLLLCASLHAADLRVSAAASLSDVMTEVSAAWEKHTGAKLILNFAGSNTLARQIEAGAPVDVFISADEKTMTGLEKKDLLKNDTIVPLLGNSLVVIGPVDSALKITSAQDLASSQIRRIALGDPASVPAGVYARTWFESQKAWEPVSKKVISTENVRGALAAVASGNVDAGIVYKTDAAISDKVKILFAVPEDETPSILYPVAVCLSTKQPEAALNLIAFLRQKEARAIFQKYGFTALRPSK